MHYKPFYLWYFQYIFLSIPLYFYYLGWNWKGMLNLYGTHLKPKPTTLYFSFCWNFFFHTKSHAMIISAGYIGLPFFFFWNIQKTWLFYWIPTVNCGSCWDNSLQFEGLVLSELIPACCAVSRVTPLLQTTSLVDSLILSFPSFVADSPSPKRYTLVKIVNVKP